MSTPTIRVVGCGSPDAGDDAVGLHLADRLRSLLPSTIDIRSDTRGGAGIPDWCDGADVLVLIDAAQCSPSLPPGTVLRLAYPEERRRIETVPMRNSHGIGVAAGLQLAGALEVLPSVVLIWVIAGEQFEKGRPLSPAVARAMAAVVNEVQAEIQRRLLGPLS